MSESGMRLDVVLHELRLFKSRNQALTAIDAGEVLLNGLPAKPSRAVRPGDRLTITRPGVARTLEVVDLPRRSMRRDEAQALVREVESP